MSLCSNCPLANVGATAALIVCCALPVAAHGQQTTPDSAHPRTTLTRVTVRDTANRRRPSYSTQRTSSATRTDVPLRDVPQSAAIVTKTLIGDQAMRGMADVVRYVPGVTMGQGEGHRDAPVMRGQSTTADFFIDGARDDAQYYRDVYNVERVEALKGPNAMIFGRGGGGGVINRVMKQATWAPVREIALTGGSFRQRRATADIGGVFSPTVAWRVNALHDNSATFREFSGAERSGVNPTLAVLAGGTLIQLGYERVLDHRIVDRGVPSFQGGPSSAPIRTFFGDPTASRSRLKADGASAIVSRTLIAGAGGFDGLQLRNRTQWMQYDKFYQNVFPGAVTADGAAVSISGYNNDTQRTNFFNQTDLTASLTRGNVHQTLLLGAELARQETGNLRKTGYFGATGSAPATVTAPFTSPLVRGALTFAPSATDGDSHTMLTSSAIYAQHQSSVGAHLQTVLGLRADQLALDFRNNRNAQELRRRDVLISPRAGLVLKPVEALSVYGSYSVSFLPGSGDQFGSLTVTTQTLEPEQFTNRELGVKWDVRNDFAVTGAVYRLDRTNTSAPDPLLPGVVVQTGAQRSVGWELSVTGAPTARWQIAGGYSNQVATIVARTSGAAAGARVPLVPRQTVSIWNRYQMHARMGAGVGVIQQATMFTAIDNTVSLPAFTRIDAAVFLTLSRTLRAQINIENLLDRQYYPTSHNNNNIMPGSPRLIRVGLTAVQ
jgi:catecholate siderophore receptor